MILFVLLLGSVLSAPTDEFGEFTKGGADNLLPKNDKLIKNIVPSGMSPHKMQQPSEESSSPNEVEMEEVVDYELEPKNKYFREFKGYLERGVVAKGRTFTVYDEEMGKAAVSLFRVFQNAPEEIIEKVKEWVQENTNKEMYMYALRLDSLYDGKTNQDTLLPPFIWNPNYFINSEALAKAALVCDDIRTNGKIDLKIAETDQYSYTFDTINEFVTINANYSGWNLPDNGRQDNLNYFREDISLNSYYLGVHLLHPFWMSNEELDAQNPRHAEHYYYAHRQLMARYELEKLHLMNENATRFKSDGTDYIPYLRYKNGLPFPTRSCIQGDWGEKQLLLKNIDIAIKEFIPRGLLIMQNGTTLTLKNDNDINLIAKLIRANLDGALISRVIRAIFGYGGSAFPIDDYQPAPSLLHHPETSLRDPIYWHLIQHMLNYFYEYLETMDPFDMSQYETDDIHIIDSEFTKITTYFDYYQFTVNYATSYNIRDVTDWPAYISVRQRRLKHKPFSFNFTVDSATDRETIVRLYLGPECRIDSCWSQHTKFYELDTFPYKLDEGLNSLVWTPDSSKRLSFDYYFDTVLPRSGSTRHSIYKFPENLLIPRGLDQGLNLTLFVLITPADEDTDQPKEPLNAYKSYTREWDSKPLGFPFHRQSAGFKENATNYKFYNISIYHKRLPVDDKGYFSPHLY